MNENDRDELVLGILHMPCHAAAISQCQTYVLYVSVKG